MILSFRKKYLSLFVTAVFVCISLFSPFAASTVHAETDPEDYLVAGAAACAGINFIVLGIGSLLSSFGVNVPTDDTLGNFVETFVDCLIYQVGNAMIQMITDGIIEWIQGGFEGNPAFATDLRQLYTDIADDIAGEFIGTALAPLCDPIRPQIQIALLQDYLDSPEERLQCSLSDIVGNVSGFIEGDFKQGGWVGWFELTQSPQNHPYGAFIIAKDELSKQLAQKLGEEEKKLDYGRGFFTKEVCEQIPIDDPDDGPPRYKEVCRSNTPGVVIEKKANEVLGSGLRRLEMADEINEIVNALIAFLIQSILTGDEGLLGYDPDDFEDVYELPDLPETDFPFGGDQGSSCDPNGGTAGTGTRSFTLFGGGPWTPTAASGQNSEFVRGLGLTGHYNDVDLSFDFQFDEFHPESIFQRIFHVRNSGMQNPGCFIDAFIQPGGAIFNLCDNAVGNHWIHRKGGISWEQGAWYHFDVDYSASEQRAALRITKGRGGNGDMVVTLWATPESTIWPEGHGTSLFISGGYLPDGVHPLYGSKWENLSFEIRPGAPVCNTGSGGGGSVLGPGAGGGSGGGSGGGGNGGGSGGGGGTDDDGGLISN